MFFTTTVIASTTDQAIAKVDRFAEKAAVRPTGRALVRDAKHLLVDVEVELLGDRNNAWVILTSYGMSPSESLGSMWQSVPGVGVFPD